MEFLLNKKDKITLTEIIKRGISHCCGQCPLIKYSQKNIIKF